MHNTEYITLDLINGYKINAFYDDLITKEIIQHGIYEKTLFLFLKSFLKTNNNFNCIDIGANIGVVTLTMCQYAKKVVSFEPTPETFKLLKSNIQKNNISNCEIHNTGLSNVTKLTSFFVQSKGNIGSSTLYPQDDSEYRTETSIPLEVGDQNNSIRSLKKVDLIKIDVEGNEPNVILGLKETIQKSQPIIILEWDNNSTRNGFSQHKIFETILPNYHIFQLSSKMSSFRQFSKKNKLTAPFRSILRLLYKLCLSNKFLEQPVLLSNFDIKKCYSSIILVPKHKIDIISQYT